MKKIVSCLLGIALLGGISQKAENMSIDKEIYSKQTYFEMQSPAITCGDGFDESIAVDSVNLAVTAKSAYLTDSTGRYVLYAKDELKRLPIASMCKIMTLLLTFEAIEQGGLAFDELITVSETAAGMGGSQVFLEAHAKYPVKELIKSIVVCSANDSCVALAERICGSESLFTDKMNEKAKQIGMENTLFANCTGLPKEPQYSCAKDVALMLKELITHKEYFEFGQIWMDKFQHPEGRYTEISNTNKLVRFYDGCDGGKTGFTNQAGFCLAATAKRDNTRVISVVIGEETSNTRFSDVRQMFDYAFANYSSQEVVVGNQTILEKKSKVIGGKVEEVCICPSRSSYVFGKRGEKKNVTLEYEFSGIKAPFEKGEKVGRVTIYEDNVAVDCVDLLTAEGVEKANLYDTLKKISNAWNLK